MWQLIAFRKILEQNCITVCYTTDKSRPRLSPTEAVWDLGEKFHLCLCLGRCDVCQSQSAALAIHIGTKRKWRPETKSHVAVKRQQRGKL